MLRNCRDVLSVPEVAELIHVSKRSVYLLLQRGELRHKKVGRIYRIPKSAVVDYLENS